MRMRRWNRETEKKNVVSWLFLGCLLAVLPLLFISSRVLSIPPHFFSFLRALFLSHTHTLFLRLSVSKLEAKQSIETPGLGGDHSSSSASVLLSNANRASNNLLSGKASEDLDALVTNAEHVRVYN